VALEYHTLIQPGHAAAARGLEAVVLPDPGTAVIFVHPQQVCKAVASDICPVEVGPVQGPLGCKLDLALGLEPARLVEPSDGPRVLFHAEVVHPLVAVNVGKSQSAVI
jgi:hypothetical protein